MQLNSYLNFNGQCEEAFQLYAKCLGGKIEAMITHAGTPAEAHTPPEWLNKIMHARLSVGNSLSVGSDSTHAHYQKPPGALVNIGLDDPAEAERIFHTLSEGGTVGMPIQQTFWAARFGMLVDRFGILWMVNCDNPKTQEEA